jgi:hypothetical protein
MAVSAAVQQKTSSHCWQSCSSALLLLCAAAAFCCCPQLVTEKSMSLKQLKFFVIDECDKVLEKSGEQHRSYCFT